MCNVDVKAKDGFLEIIDLEPTVSLKPQTLEF
jgi:hypothetical protein